ncbi:MAG: OsmC family protein [Rhodospirillaceae bacterium]|jgi:uncharacterized OsmC-like protein|nr:OsmC family protein [Rhodospirillaceae bacterium]
MSNEEVKTFEVVIDAKAKAVGKMRNEVTILSGVSGKTYEMATDEGPVHGGESTAPPPLAYFATAMVACLMTQLRAFSKRLDVPLNDVSVAGRCHWRGTVVGRNPYETEPIAFDLDIELDTEASLEDQKKLIDAAKKGCFIEQTLGQSNDIGHRLKVGDDWIEV